MNKKIDEFSKKISGKSMKFKDETPEIKNMRVKRLNNVNLNNSEENRISKRKNKSTEELKERTKRTKSSAEMILAELIGGLKVKQVGSGDKMSDYNNQCETPLLDVLENDTTIIVRVNLPGVKKEDISVHLTEDNIEIMALFPGKGDPGHYLTRERNFGKTIGSIALSKRIKEKAVTSTFKDCVLTIELPKLIKDRYKVDIK